MTRRLTRDLKETAQTIKRPAGSGGAELRQGTVRRTDPLTIVYGGTEVPEVAMLSETNYSPQNGDTVNILKDGPVLLVLGPAV